MRHFNLYNRNIYKRFPPGHGFWREKLARARFKIIMKYVQVKEGDKVLEVGCDEDIMLKMFEHKGAVGYGIEIDKTVVKLANHARIELGNAEELSFTKDFFDLIIASHVIEHLKNSQEFLREAIRVTKKNGKIVLIYPLEFFPGMTIIPELLLSGQSIYKMRDIHKHCFTPAKIKELTKNLPVIHEQSKLFLGFPCLALQYFTLLKVQK
ncbi:MAG: class I SAM-dependent methyltransferase [Candidatus Kuenenbacteria bacterium]